MHLLITNFLNDLHGVVRKTKIRKPDLRSISCLFVALIFAVLFCHESGSAQSNGEASLKAGEVQPQLVVQLGNLETGLVAYSPDGNLALTAVGNRSTDSDFSICLWDVETGKLLRRFIGHTAAVTAVAFSYDSRFAASASHDDTARIWDVRTGTEVKRFSHPTWTLIVAFSPDGTNLLTGSGVPLFNEGGLAYIWDIPSGREIRRLIGHSNNVNAAAYSPDGQTIITGSGDSTARLWRASDGQLLHTLSGHTFPVVSVAFSSDGKTVATGSGDKTARVWEVATGRELKKITCPSYVDSVAFSPDGHYLLTGSYQFENQIHLWDLATGADVRGFKAAGNAVFSPDARYVLLSGEHGVGSTASLWETASGKLVRRFESVSTNVFDVAVSSDSRFLATVSGGSLCRLWDLTTGRMVQRIDEGFEVNNGQMYSIQAVTFSPDGKYLVTAEDNDILTQKGGGVQFWDLNAGGKDKRVATGPSRYVAVSPDNQFIATGIGTSLTNTDSNAYLYSVAANKQVKKFTGHTGTVQYVAFSRDGRLLLTMPNNISSNTDDPPRLWDAKSGRELRKFTPPSSPDKRADAVALSPDGRLVAASTREVEDGKDGFVVLLWDASTGQLLKTLKGHTNQVDSIAFSSDSRLIVTGSWDTSVRLWDVNTGQKVKSFVGHGNSVDAVRFTADDRFIISASSDATVRLWAVSMGQELCRLISLNNDDWVVVTPDGRFDTNNLEEIRGLHWLMPDDPLKPVPLEIFMRQYYEPRLLARILEGEKFKPIPSIATLNRVQPTVAISRIEPEKETPDQVSVTVEVANNSGMFNQNGSQVRVDSGVFDVRLFRDGELVGYAPEKDGQVKLDSTGKATLTFPHIKLPHNSEARQVEISAYAFNSDRVKSQTATKMFDLPNNLESKKGRAYIITVGVNAYENTDFDLEFAADDARRMQQVMTEKLTATGRYEDVVPVSLISDYKEEAGQKIPTLKQATKENFKAVLQLLSNKGNTVAPEMIKSIPNAEKLSAATPDDLVLIMFSSHGYADGDGNFYFIPYDTGAGRGKVFTEMVRRQSISSEELSFWLRDIDAGEMVMIVDACHSTAAVEGQEFKPGPMGSRGLGQLSYDKGMRILTATQADNVALENGTLKQGLLTYALVRDGIEAGQADFKPKDNVITMSEWLQYGVERVPRFYEEVKNGKVQTFGLANNQTKVVVTSGGKELDEVIGAAISEAKTQRPSLFDFARKRQGAVLTH